MMTALLLAMMFAQTPRPEVHMARPNVFEPNELSSESIFAAVAVCMDDAIRNGATEKDAVVVCGCLMDATRLNIHNGAKAPNRGATQEQRAKCETLVKPPPKTPEKKGKAGV